MKTKRNKLELRYTLTSVMGIALILAFFILSCTEVVEPSKSKKRTLTIQAMVKDCNTGLPTTPAAGTKISIYKYISVNDKSLLGTVYADNTGKAIFTSEGPVSGIIVQTLGEYKNQFKTTTPRGEFLLCNDTTVNIVYECTPPPIVCCTDIGDTTIPVTFTNGTDTKLVQNQPLGVASYDAVTTIICNRLNCTPPSDYTIAVPNPNAPFTLKAIYVKGQLSGNPATLKSGECLSLVFSVSTKDAGVFRTSVPLTISCDGKNSTWNVALNADVVPEECDCPMTGDTTIIIKPTTPQKLPVGTSYDYEELFFQNQRKCVMTVESFVRIKSGVESPATTAGEWKLISPNLPTVVNQGDVYMPKLRFSPTQTGERRDTFRVTVRLSSGIVCNFKVIMIGYGCTDACPQVNGQPFSNAPINLSAEAPFSPDAVCPKTLLFNSIARLPITVTYPRDACSSSVDINATFTGKDQYDAVRFSYTTSFTVDTNSPSGPNLTFVAPTVAEYESMFTQNGGTRTKQGTREDSAYNLTVVLATADGKCRQVINVKAFAAPAGKLSIPWNMDAYDQTTAIKPTPDYQTCKVDTLMFFAGVDRPGFVYQLRDASYQPYCGVNQPPCWGSFYINVDNKNGEGTVGSPKPPKIYLVNNPLNVFKDIKLVARNFLEEDFDKINPVLIKLQNDVSGVGPGNYFTSDATTQPYFYPNGLGGLAIGDVYVLYSNSKNSSGIPCELAMIYLRKVFNYGGFSSNNRSSIEFRILYPIYIHK